jgi:hypothetical protein
MCGVCDGCVWMMCVCGERCKARGYPASNNNIYCYVYVGVNVFVKD